MEQIIQYIINTLNLIEIRGKDNMDKMLGAIYALESLAGQARTILPTPQAPPKEEDKGEQNLG